MSGKAQTVYDLMLEEFKRTKERHVSIKVPFQLRDQRREITDELEAEGLVAKVRIYGSDYIECELIDDQLYSSKVTY